MPRNTEPLKGPLIAPSILSADFSRLADEAAAVTRADWLHVDVMDNHFVPNLTLGLPVVESLLAATTIPMDCHLMIEDPDRWAPPYAEAGAYNVTFHAEATQNPIAVARDIRAGTVTINCYGEGDVTTPFGGFKLSGFGGRDKSLHAHDQYTELKTVWTDISDPKQTQTLD